MRRTAENRRWLSFEVETRRGQRIFPWFGMLDGTIHLVLESVHK